MPSTLSVKSLLVVDLITKVYFNEHLTHSCVGMPQGLQALLSSLLLHEDWGECSEDWAGACRWGGGILGCLGRPTPPPGGRAGSENDTLLPMTMTCDRLKFWSGPTWRSKSYHPETLAAEE